MQGLWKYTISKTIYIVNIFHVSLNIVLRIFLLHILWTDRKIRILCNHVNQTASSIAFYLQQGTKNKAWQLILNIYWYTTILLIKSEISRSYFRLNQIISKIHNYHFILKKYVNQISIEAYLVNWTSDFNININRIIYNSLFMRLSSDNLHAYTKWTMKSYHIVHWEKWIFWSYLSHYCIR